VTNEKERIASSDFVKLAFAMDACFRQCGDVDVINILYYAERQHKNHSRKE